MDLGSELNIVEKSGAWYSYGGERIGQGKDNAREYLRAKSAWRARSRTRSGPPRASLHVARKSSPADAGSVNPTRESGNTSLLSRAISLLARREHSRAELARKLAHRLDDGQDQSDVEAVLDELQRRRLLSDERFAASLVSDPRAALWRGAAEAGTEDTRGAGRDRGGGALGSLHASGTGSELDRARAVWSRRFGKTPQSLAERARQARFLQSRGFSAEVIRKVLRGLPGDDDG